MYKPEKNVFYKAIRQDGSTYSFSRWTFGNPSISLGLLAKNEQYHQVDFWPVSFSSESEKLLDTTTMTIIEGDKEILVSGMARYRYRLISPVSSNSWIYPYIDVGAFFYYHHINFKPFVSLSYPENETEFSIGPSIIPGVKFNIGERIYLDFNIPVNLVEAYLTRHHTDNPVLPNELRTSSTLSIYTFRRWTAQLGVGIYL